MPFQAPVHPCSASRAGPARLEYLDSRAIAGDYAPALRRPRSDGLDRAHRLVTGNEGEPARQLAGVLLVVGPAQPAGFHPHDRIVVADHRDRKLPDNEAARALQYQRPRHRAVGHTGTVKTC